MSVNERQKENKRKLFPGWGPFKTFPFLGRQTISPSLSLGRVTAGQIEPRVRLEGVDGVNLERHGAAVQFAPRGPEAGLQIEFVTEALLDGELSHARTQMSVPRWMIRRRGGRGGGGFTHAAELEAPLQCHRHAGLVVGIGGEVIRADGLALDAAVDVLGVRRAGGRVGR